MRKAALVFVVIAVGCGVPRWTVQHGNTTYYTLDTEEQAFLEENEQALADLAQRSPTANELFQFYRDASVPAGIKLPRTVLPTGPLPTPTGFYMVPAVHDPVIADPKGPIVALFQTDIDALVLRGNGFCQLVRGVNFAHELVHARRHLRVGIARPTDNDCPARRHEETVVMLALDSILDEYTAKAWSRAMDECVDRHGIDHSPSGIRSDAILALQEADHNALENIFPDINVFQRFHLTEQYLFGVNLRKIAREEVDLHACLVQLEGVVQLLHPKLACQ